jgi:hypothetical protein
MNNTTTNESGSPLPYQDTKPVGAPDFYFAINATFRFILNTLGLDGLKRYWTDLGSNYFAPVTARWQQEGLKGVASYWRGFFDAEPAAEVNIVSSENAITLDVRTCPAILHLRTHGRAIVPCFCQHCYYISEAMAAPAGLTVRIEGGNGSCRQIFAPVETKLPPQDLTKIKEATC